MIIVLFHVLYLFGKFVYQNYGVNKRKDDDVINSIKYDTFGTGYPMMDPEDPEAYEDKPTIRFFPPAYVQRYVAVTEVLNNSKYQGKLRKIVDFGCAELEFLVYLKNTTGVEEILCVDIERSLLEECKKKGAPLISEYLHTRTTPLVVEICEGSVTHNDKKLEKTDAVICIELIEHLYPETLEELPRNIFGFIKPKLAVMTTPNADFNVLFPNLTGFRHPDHKFEWTRQQFQDWAENIVTRYPEYIVTFDNICKGPEGTEHLGGCSQMAVFHRLSEKDSCNMGVEGLFKSVAVHEYPFRADNRSDEEKILDEAAYYIWYLSFQDYEMEEEVPLKKVLEMLRSFHISQDVLKTVLEEAGWTILHRQTGLTVQVPPRSTFSDYSAEERYWSNEFSDTDDDDWDQDPGPPIGSMRFPEEQSYVSTWNNENWGQEPSIMIPENNSVAVDNTYLFDGENALLDSISEATRDAENLERCEEPSSRPEEDPEAKPSLSGNTDRMSVDDTNDSIKDNVLLDLNVSAVSSDSLCNMNLADVKEDMNLTDVNSSLDSTHPSDTQYEALSNMYNHSVNFQECMSMSRASTSPEPYLLQSKDDSMCNESMSACWTLNSSFKQANTSKESKCKELSSRTETSDGLLSIYLNTTFKESDESEFECWNSSADARVKPDATHSPQQDSNALKDDQKSQLISDAVTLNQPQFTSSPKIVAKTISTTGKRRSLDGSKQRDGSAMQQLQATKLCSNNSMETSGEVLSQSNNDSDARCDAMKELHDEPRDSTDAPINSNDNTRSSCDVASVVVSHISSSSDETWNSTVIDKEKQSIQSTNCDTGLACRWLDVEQSRDDFVHQDEGKTEVNFSQRENVDNTKTSNDAKDISNLNVTLVSSSSEVQSTSVLKQEKQAEAKSERPNIVQISESIAAKPPSPEEAVETPPNSWSPEVMDSGYPNSASVQDITPEYDLSSIAQDHISDSEPPSIAEAPRIGVHEPVEVENGDLANNNRDGEGNNMMAAEVNELEDLQPLIDVLENDLENENDIYALENDFPIWLLRILDMGNPIDVDMQMRDRRELRLPDRAADDARHLNMERDEGFNSSSEEDSDLENNGMRDDDNSDINENAVHSDSESDQWAADGT